MPEIRMRDLTMEYSSGGYVVRPFDHFELDLATGNLALLLGASGCGKTTLLSMLASILTPTSGSIHVGDIEVIFVEEPDTRVSALGVKGLGEIGLVGVAAAVANAIFHATGARVRDLPITIDKIRAARAR